MSSTKSTDTHTTITLSVTIDRPAVEAYNALCAALESAWFEYTTDTYDQVQADGTKADGDTSDLWPCDECGAAPPVTSNFLPWGSVSPWHERSCSLHPSNVVTPEGGRS